MDVASHLGFLSWWCSPPSGPQYSLSQFSIQNGRPGSTLCEYSHPARTRPRCAVIPPSQRRRGLAE
jgi:hypothetical protein